MEKVIIIGGGMSGLIASYVFKQYGKNATVYEPYKLGGDFLLGGLKYIHRTDKMCDLFDDLDLPWSDYSINGGIMLKGQVLPYPKCLFGMSKFEAKRILEDHYRKTRRTEPGPFSAKAMNDPAKVSRRAIRCDFEDMVKALANRTIIVKEGLQQLVSNQNCIRTTEGKTIGYDYLVFTIPLWMIQQMTDFYVPTAMAMSLNLIEVSPVRDRYTRWDYVYTPYTPAGAIHRISPAEYGYSIEVNGDWKQQEEYAFSDLAFIFPDGFLVRGVKAGLKGHLLELEEQPEYPSNIAPLGRFAQWNPRATLDCVLECSHKVAEKWNW